MNLREQLKGQLQGKGQSQAQAARQIGISAAALSSWLSASYRGDNAALERKVERYLSREQQRTKVLQIPIVRTQNYAQIDNCLAICQEECDIAVITGAAGTGKTTAALGYTEASDAIYLKAHRGLSMHKLMDSLCQRLGLSDLRGLARMAEALAEALKDRDTIVIIDEAEYLSNNALELLRQVVYDNGACALALIGLPKLEYIIRNMANDHQQLLSRVGLGLKLEPIPEEDFDQMIQAAWPQLDAKLRKQIYRLSENRNKHQSSPSLRSCAKILARLWRTHIKFETPPDAYMLEKVSNFIMT